MKLNSSNVNTFPLSAGKARPRSLGNGENSLSAIPHVPGAGNWELGIAGDGAVDSSLLEPPSLEKASKAIEFGERWEFPWSWTPSVGFSQGFAEGKRNFVAGVRNSAKE